MIIIEPMNCSFSKIYCDGDQPEHFMDLWEKCSFYADGYRFMQKYKCGLWDGQIHLINRNSSTVPTGFIDAIENFCKNNEIELENKVSFLGEFDVDKETLDKFFDCQTYYCKGETITPRDDQKEAVYRAIQLGRAINICPTSFGKSLCIYMQCQWNYYQERKTLIVVPSIALVDQMQSDFIDYGNGDSRLGRLYAIKGGISKDIPEDTNVVVSTWQSIYKLGSDWMNQFDCIIVDEAHTSKAACLQGIFEKATEVKYRTGWTGSLKQSSVNEMLVHALIGPAKKITTTRKLMDDGIVADININAIILKYPDKLCKQASFADYWSEIAYLEESVERNHKICQFASITKKTGLILFTHIKHGTSLYKTLRKLCPDRNVYLIHGDTFLMNDEKFRSIEDLKPYIEQDSNGIVVGIVTMIGTGISIKNLHWIFFATPFKSYVRTIQTIGRGLRISKTKHKLNLVDFCDDLCTYTKSGKIKRANYAYNHFCERHALYLEEGFPVKSRSFALDIKVEE